MHALTLKIPPPVLAALAMLLMYLTHVALPQLTLSTWTRWIIAVVSLAIGGGIAVMSIFQFRQEKTTVKPNPDKTTALITQGVYRYTRNPMYLGLVICLIGFAGFLNSLYSLIWVIAFVCYLTRFQIIPEEKALMNKFPDAYQTYRHNTRRWI